MQVFWTDNFNRESIAERCIVSGLTVEQAEAVVKELQFYCTESGSNWYRTAEEGAKPWGGMDEFV